MTVTDPQVDEAMEADPVPEQAPPERPARRRVPLWVIAMAVAILVIWAVLLSLLF